MNNQFRIYCICILFGFSVPCFGQKVIEKIDRGVVALTVGKQQIYVGWRLLREDPANVAFNVYRREPGVSADFKKINSDPITASTNFVDTGVENGHAYRYRIKRIVNGKEEETAGEAYAFMRPASQPSYSIFLLKYRRPSCTYQGFASSILA